MKTIAFYQPHLDIRGTGVSNFDDSVNVENILGHKAVMICDKGALRSHPLAVKKCKDQLNVIELPCREDMGLLKNKELYYAKPNGLYKVLRDFKPQLELDWNCYRYFSPEKVMSKFDEVFLQKLG
jgi:hypothetical protein